MVHRSPIGWPASSGAGPSGSDPPAPCAASRAGRSLQATQISGGMMPARMRSANTWHPRHNASAASRVAATATIATSTIARPVAPASHATSAPTLSVAPMPWAKRFGGPGTSLAGTGRRGTTTRVTRRASGLNRGPASTRSTKPAARVNSSTGQRVTRKARAWTTTPAATNRAATSLTGFGNRSASGSLTRRRLGAENLTGQLRNCRTAVG